MCIYSLPARFPISPFRATNSPGTADLAEKLADGAAHLANVLLIFHWAVFEFEVGSQSNRDYDRMIVLHGVCIGCLVSIVVGLVFG